MSGKSVFTAVLAITAGYLPLARSHAEPVPDYLRAYAECQRAAAEHQKDVQSRSAAMQLIASMKSKHRTIVECAASTADVERLSEARDDAERRLRSLEDQCRKANGDAAACREVENIRSVLASRNTRLTTAVDAEGRNCMGVPIDDIAHYRDAVKRLNAADSYAFEQQAEAKSKACDTLWIVISQNRILGDWLVPQSDTVIRFVAVGRPGPDIIMEGRAASGDLADLKPGEPVFSEVMRDREAAPPDDDSQMFRGMYFNVGVQPPKWMPARIVVRIASDRLEVSSGGDTLELIRFRPLPR